MLKILTPLRPLSPARANWEQAVTEQLAAVWEADYGDCAGFMEAHPVEVDELFAAGATPVGAVSILSSMEG